MKVQPYPPPPAASASKTNLLFYLPIKIRNKYHIRLMQYQILFHSSLLVKLPFPPRIERAYSGTTHNGKPLKKGFRGFSFKKQFG